MTDERREKVDFSEPFFKAGTALIVRKDRKKDEIAIKVLDNEYNPKDKNTADIRVKFPKRETYSNCVFPEEYNETITINCAITDLKDIDPYNEGFEYVDSTDKIGITYSKLDAGNFFKANSKLTGHEVISESDKSKKVCSSTPPSTSSSPSPSTSPSDDNTIKYQQTKKKSSKLSTGAIIAIIIPCVLVLLGVLIFAIMKAKDYPNEFPHRSASIHNIQEIQGSSVQSIPVGNIVN